ncbi:hypothetical protein SSCHL_1493 [Staphylococcus schleiferi]|uniref:hypothetical protein n=1 Tax=Staphylococcus TaxID=1279 RepID=UPI00067A21C5|nr:hypothetical protein [Staphylococcus coagulans]AKS67281.1 hypothetical protein LH95_07380 [Staphylococcus schleiferi]MBA8773648.1 hypothetical protein [Staphylococcus coagulans]MBT2813734.1 hypothetical protein [Staphylococcus coagulans]MBT2815997.1 hypothetical protein [Staphylococcus coagulans]MBT2829767.1 hypothetical protein [Staphylococcus coagulans]
MLKLLRFELNKMEHSLITLFLLLILLYPIVWGIIIKSNPSWLQIGGKVGITTFILTMVQLLFTFKLHYIFILFVYSQFTNHIVGGQIIYELVRFPNRVINITVKMVLLILIPFFFVTIFNLISFLAYKLFVKNSDIYLTDKFEKGDFSEILTQSFFIVLYLIVLMLTMVLISLFIKSFSSVIVVIVIDIIMSVFLSIKDLKIYLPNFVALNSNIEEISRFNLYMNGAIVLSIIVLLFLFIVFRYKRFNT